MVKTQNSFSFCNSTLIFGRGAILDLSQISIKLLNKSKIGTAVQRNLILCSSSKKSSPVSSTQSKWNENFPQAKTIGNHSVWVKPSVSPDPFSGSLTTLESHFCGNSEPTFTFDEQTKTNLPNTYSAPLFKSFKSKKLKWVPMEYKLDTFQRSNQDTCLNHRPAVFEGDWVQSGELLTDCASSVGGELALGQNLLIAYMPWEGYNFEDAILISERLVIDDLYTSVHIERYDIETHNTKLGNEEITREIPDVSEKEIEQLDSCGIVRLGSWVEEGDILVGKITPINKKAISPYQKLLYTILEKQVRPFRDTSLRAPKGIKAKVINIKYFLRSSDQPNSLLFGESGEKSNASLTKKASKKIKMKKTGQPGKSPKAAEGILGPSGHIILQSKMSSNKTKTEEKLNLGIHAPTKSLSSAIFEAKDSSNREKTGTNRTETTKRFFFNVNKIYFSKDLTRRKFNSKKKFYKTMAQVFALGYVSAPLLGGKKSSLKGGLNSTQNGFFSKRSMERMASDSTKTTKKLLKSKLENVLLTTKLSAFKGKNNPTAILKQIETIHIYLAEKRKVQVGDKMAGRHGNKGIVSQILPIQDMPYLPDGTPIDMVLNPLGVPSRMNVGQIYECLLGLAGKYLGENYKVISFDEVYGPEASRSFVFNKLYEASRKTSLNWLFNPNSPGKIRLYDGRTGDTFDQSVTVGRAYMLRLVHMVDDKIHMRSTGPYSLVTQQPLRGRSKQGGQRLGEMEVWALEGYGAAFTLLEMLTIKSDDMTGRMTLWSNLILNREISIGTPESFKVLICELQALCMDIGLFRYNQTAANDAHENETSDPLLLETEQGNNSLGPNSTQNVPSNTGPSFNLRSNNISKNQFTEIKNLINLP